MYNKILNNIPLSEIVKHLEEERNKAFILWGVDDVISRAKEQGVELLENQAKEIIQTIHNSCDCDEGINWVTIDTHVHIYITDNDLETLEMLKELLKEAKKSGMSSWIDEVCKKMDKLTI